MVESLLVVKIHGEGKYTGQRVVRSVEKVNSLKWRVILASGLKIFVQDVTVLREVEKKQ